MVAGEVRKLAERSQEAAHQIGELAGRSVAVAENAGRLLGEIVPSIRRTSELIREIAATSQEQTSAIHEISTGVRQLEEVVQQNVSASVELASTARLPAPTQATTLEHLVGSSGSIIRGTQPSPGADLSARPDDTTQPDDASAAPSGARALPPAVATPARLGFARRSPRPGGIVVNLDQDAGFERF